MANTILLKKLSHTVTGRQEICVFHALIHTWVNGAITSLIGSFSASQPTWYEDVLENPTQ